MKKSNLFLGASAFVLAISGAFATKAAKISHLWTYATAGVKKASGCVVHSQIKSVTNVRVLSAKTVLTGSRKNITVYTKNCTKTLFTIAD